MSLATPLWAVRTQCTFSVLPQAERGCRLASRMTCAQLVSLHLGCNIVRREHGNPSQWRTLMPFSLIVPLVEKLARTRSCAGEQLAAFLRFEFDGLLCRCHCLPDNDWRR